MARPTERDLLEGPALQKHLAECPQWAINHEGRLARTFKFKNFSEAFGFMARVALVAEQLGHHPEIFNVYSRVEIGLWTHDSGGVTGLDFSFASLVDAFG
ncbi:4a-hydroxytetrahydrobiopterin dehydratase [Pelagibacterium montanilacus]|uniref:4a-hydroxytetrahydrobiopterin dehydratase n=1 Tax=Pelagibacterium montanilacus TaxID=2185280 RepID=UPI000F8C9D51|nr:4a-hydroxytetrahydrobiopterin dehydratase [Pelagibacterium montanilacus]